MFPRPTTLPALDGPPRPLTLRITPLTDEEIPAWSALLKRLPAIRGLEPAVLLSEDRTAVFTVQAASVARLHAQLQHLADRMQAIFGPAADGTLSLLLRPATATSRAWGRVVAYRTALACGATVAAGAGRDGRS